MNGVNHPPLIDGTAVSKPYLMVSEMEHSVSILYIAVKQKPVVSERFRCKEVAMDNMWIVNFEVDIWQAMG